MVYSPVDGEVVQVADTKHAVGIVTADGAEILIHVGMDTVDMKGEGFTPKVKVGDKVSRGQELLAFSFEAIKAAGHPATTAIVITNSDEFQAMSFETGSHGKGDKIAAIN